MLVYVAPYRRQDDQRITLKLEAQLALCMKRLDKVEYNKLHKHLIKERTARFPPPDFEAEVSSESDHEEQGTKQQGAEDPELDGGSDEDTTD